jgi:hypothetical protein
MTISDQRGMIRDLRDVIRKTELIGWDVWPAHHKRRKIPVEPDEGTDTPEEE